MNRFRTFTLPTVAWALLLASACADDSAPLVSEAQRRAADCELEAQRQVEARLTEVTADHDQHRRALEAAARASIVARCLEEAADAPR